jgi:GNAT superfamily N-acetyltransferase
MPSKQSSAITRFALHRCRRVTFRRQARKHIPRYPLVSATLIGRLAVSRTRQGDGLGSLLLADAVRRANASAETVGSAMLVADALNERTAAFYESFGFQPLPESLRLMLPMRSIEQVLAR